MHQAQSYIDSIYPAGSALPPLTAAQASALTGRLRDDAFSYAYSGALSLAEAITSTNNCLYSWSTVKSYYATFYFVRSILALRKIAVFYRGHTPYATHSSAGDAPAKAKGTTHECVLNQFRQRLPAHWLISQNIGSTSPLEWIKARREETNYKIPRFVEPNIPPHFVTIERVGVRRSVSAYVKDDYFAFDPDHAIIAYPLRALILVRDEFSAQGLSGLGASEKSYIASQCKDKSGQINDFSNALF